VKIDNVYRPYVSTCSPTDLLRDVAQHMQRENTGLLVVESDAGLDGVISERDLVRALASETDPSNASVMDYATTQVVTAELGEETSDIAHRMFDARIRRVPVTGPDGALIGIISMRDLLALESFA
jgi:signal-transduction protein with cAMP-binding, CBS, and nucleotidyltransferase domain